METTPDTTIPLPTIHSNGTSRKTLTKEYGEALDAFDSAISKIRNIQFHSRDYYVKSDTAFEEAKAEREEIFRQLNYIREYLFNHYTHLEPEL